MVFKVFSVAKICIKPQSAPLMNLASNVAQLLLNTYKHHDTVVPFIFSILCLCPHQGIVTSYLCDIFFFGIFIFIISSVKRTLKKGMTRKIKYQRIQGLWIGEGPYFRLLKSLLQFLLWKFYYKQTFVLMLLKF